jgi:hypothetical protein
MKSCGPLSTSHRLGEGKDKCWISGRSCHIAISKILVFQVPLDI